MDAIRLRDRKTGCGIGVITGISYDDEEKCLLLSSTVGMAWVLVEDGESLVCSIQKRHEWIAWAVTIGRCCLYSSLEGSKQVIHFCSRSGKVLWECCVPKDFYIDAAVFACGPKKGEVCRLFLLASKHGCYSYLLECVPADDAFWPGSCGSCEPKPPHPEPKPCEDLLESIALAQTALSHILNVEGEKLQRVIASTDDPDTLLAANQAVNRAVVNTTFLEQVLYQKLALIQEICGLCKPEDHGPRDPLEAESGEASRE